MRIFLHIGAEKTGTTAIQRFFSINRKLLQGASVLYSEVAGRENHMALAAAAQNEQKVDDLRKIYKISSPAEAIAFRETLAKRLMDEAKGSGCSTLVFSGEHCSSRLVDATEVAALAKILKPISEEIKIVLYIRRQDDFLCSSYSTDVKSGYTGHIVLPGPQLCEERYNYHAMLQRWSSVFGKENIICKIFESSRLKSGDVIDDFADLLGVALTGEYRRPKRVNQSLDVTSLEFLRVFNASVPRFIGNDQNRARGNVVQLLEAASKGPTIALPKEKLGAFMEQFRASNARVAEEYIGTVSQVGDPLFGEAAGAKNRQEITPINTETAVKIAAYLWQKKQEQVLKQLEELGRLRGQLSGK